MIQDPKFMVAFLATKRIISDRPQYAVISHSERIPLTL